MSRVKGTRAIDLTCPRCEAAPGHDCRNGMVSLSGAGVGVGVLFVWSPIHMERRNLASATTRTVNAIERRRRGRK